MSIFLSETKALWRARELCWVMTKREVSARYAGTAAGVIWAYIQPLLMVAAYYLVFDVVFAMRLGENAPTKAVGAFLIVGILPWLAYCDAITRGMLSLVEAGGMLQKNPLPPVLFPARSVLASISIHAPLLLGLVIAYIPYHNFQPPIISLPLLIISQSILCLFIGYCLAIMAAALRDTVQVVGFLLSIGIFISPILFPTSMFPSAWQWVLWLNPMTPWILGYQSVLLQGSWPSGNVMLAIFAWLAVFWLVLRVLLNRSRDQLVDWL